MGGYNKDSMTTPKTSATHQAKGQTLWPWLRLVNRQSLQQDFFAGLTGAVIVLPQGVAFAMLAGLPPQYGLYTAIIPVIIAALFGSSHHLMSGPTTPISIVVFATVRLIQRIDAGDFRGYLFTPLPDVVR